MTTVHSAKLNEVLTKLRRESWLEEQKMLNLKTTYDDLRKEFQELQKGFLLGQLEDEMKELLLGELEEVVPVFLFVQHDLVCGIWRIRSLTFSAFRLCLREQEKLGSSDVAEAIGEQSAMQKLIQQLKDSRQALVNAQDDMNFWKGKYHGLQVYSLSVQFFLWSPHALFASRNVVLCRVRSMHVQLPPKK